MYLGFSGKIDSTNISQQLFLENLRKQFEGEDPGDIQLETRFRELGTWTSMQALIVLASFDWDYGIMLDADEMRKAQTVQQLFEMVQKQKLDGPVSD